MVKIADDRPKLTGFSTFDVATSKWLGVTPAVFLFKAIETRFSHWRLFLVLYTLTRICSVKYIQ
jgi:hypothetical protein